MLLTEARQECLAYFNLFTVNRRFFQKARCRSYIYTGHNIGRTMLSVPILTHFSSILMVFSGVLMLSPTILKLSVPMRILYLSVLKVFSGILTLSATIITVLPSGNMVEMTILTLFSGAHIISKGGNIRVSDGRLRATSGTRHR